MPTPPAASSGFTLAETLVSIVVLGVGVLALTGTSTAIARALEGGEQRQRAAMLAADRLERLRAAPCAAGVASGSDTDHAIIGRWRTSDSAGALLVEYRVRIPDGRGGAFMGAIRSALPC